MRAGTMGQAGFRREGGHGGPTEQIISGQGEIDKRPLLQVKNCSENHRKHTGHLV